MSRRPTAAAAVLALGALGATGLCACGPSANNSIAAAARSGNRAGYVSSDGSIERLAVADRHAPLQLSGTTLAGRPWTLASARGTVVVVNVWGSWCPPCVAETPDLQRAWKQLSSAPASRAKVRFMGIDIRESRTNGAAFVHSHGVTYPSLSDEGGQAVLALQGAAPSPPTTLILDPQGRIAARVEGQASTDTVTGLVHDVLGESA